MARRPARLERAGALTPRDRIWAAIRALRHATATGSLFSAAEVALLSGQHVDTVLSYVQGLVAAGFLSLHERNRPWGRPMRALHQLRLVRDVGVEAPRVTADGKPVTAGQGRQAMWDAMRSLREFDCRELTVAASTPRHAVSVEEALTYVRALCRAGYVAVSVTSKPGTQARYRFLRSKNTGPRAPITCRDKSVMDANTGETVLRPGGKA